MFRLSHQIDLIWNPKKIFYIDDKKKLFLQPQISRWISLDLKKDRT